MNDIEEPRIRRGTALLVISMIFVGTSFAFIVIPSAFPPPDITVRVAVIDTGITINRLLSSRVIAEKSFINETYGYSVGDNSTEDSSPNGNMHGTYVAQIIAEQSENAAIINAKVITSSNEATSVGIIQAIYWSVLEQNCDIINLSIGKSPSIFDELKSVVEWAFAQNVTIVAACGNNGQNGVTGSSIESPAVYQEVISVAAIDELGTPYSFSGQGPMINRSLKPDISAAGYYSIDYVTLYGTSFAAPVVTAAAANIIRFCQDNDWTWTPGMLKAALLMSSDQYFSYESWQTGAGVVDTEAALSYIESSEKVNKLPMMVWMSQDVGPFAFEKWFINTTHGIRIPVAASTEVQLSIELVGSGQQWVNTPRYVTINQTGEIEINVNVVSSEARYELSAQIILKSEEYRTVWTQFRFDAVVPVAKVAFDFTHTPWWIDSIYGQFREAYTILSQRGIAISEIRDSQDLNLNNLINYDAIIILDPCAWAFKSINGSVVPVDYYTYSPNEINTYVAYWNLGGSIMVVGGSNASINIHAANELISNFNITFHYDRIPIVTFTVNGIMNSEEISHIVDHPVTERVDSFDHNGCTLNVTGKGVSLAYGNVQIKNSEGQPQIILRAVFAAFEGEGNSRFLVSGSNFFIDNWALNGLYQAEDNLRLMRQSVFWLLKL
ncbi:MAG: S8 family peptidase [Candidatus Thorarchaeota archaeon]